jgi:hypothetical protein
MQFLAQKAARIESAIELMKVFCSVKHYGWRCILTGNESWFYFTINFNHAWVPEGAVTPTRPRQTISSPKRTLAVFWSLPDFPPRPNSSKRTLLMLNISAIIFFTKLIESIHPPLTKMLDDKLSSISTMQPLTLRL